MAELNVTNTFTDGDVVSATNFNTNYSDIVTYVNNRNSGSSTWDGMWSKDATNIPLIANNSTGAFSVVQFKDNGTTIFEAFDGGIISYNNQSGARAYGAAQLLSSGVETQVLLATGESYDTGSEFSSSRFTAAQGGKYIVSCSVRSTFGGFVGSTAYTVLISIKKNGTVVSKFTRGDLVNSSSQPTNATVIDLINLASGDYVEFFATASIASITISSSSENGGAYIAKVA